MELPQIDLKEKANGHTLTWYLVQAVLFLLVIGLGLLVINQALEYRYRSEFLKAPCNLCAELNKNQSECITGCFQWKKTLYNSASGDLVDDFGDCYNLNGIKIECKANGRQKVNKSNGEINLSVLSGLLIRPS